MTGIQGAKVGSKWLAGSVFLGANHHKTGANHAVGTVLTGVMVGS